uniref:Uncharacterized protein n=1 Tax=Athene cunicularia TaxID=194338 RepID=A0A663NEF1_ATHCN
MVLINIGLSYGSPNTNRSFSFRAMSDAGVFLFFIANCLLFCYVQPLCSCYIFLLIVS